jgi:hypothetical protein
MYLLPTAANKPPTHNPKRGSVFMGLIQNTHDEIKNATIIPVMSLNKISHEPVRLIVIAISNRGDVLLDAVGLPKDVSYSVAADVKETLFIAQSSNCEYTRVSTLEPFTSGTKTKSSVVYSDDSILNIIFWESNG